MAISTGRQVGVDIEIIRADLEIDEVVGQFFPIRGKLEYEAAAITEPPTVLPARSGSGRQCLLQLMEEVEKRLRQRGALEINPLVEGRNTKVTVISLIIAFIF